jgi:hypothetical protein
MKELMTEDFINLLWIRNGEEKIKALRYLKNTYSLNYETAKEWTEWRRNSEE